MFENIVNASSSGGGQATTATTNTGTTTPPPPNFHWQGNQWVDQGYNYDATGRPLSAQEKAYWIQYDKNRAQNASIQRSASGGGGGGNTTNQGNALFDATTGTWSVYGVGGQKGWTSGISQADLASKLPQNLKDQYPDWYWGQTAAEQTMNRDYQQQRQTDRQVQDAQRFDPLTSYHYQPTSID